MAFSRGARSLASSLLLASALAGCGSSNDNKGSSGPDLCAGVSGACLGFAALIWWIAQPEYRVLFSGLPAEDAGVITGKLQTKGVPFKLASGGTTILVPADGGVKDRNDAVDLFGRDGKARRYHAADMGHGAPGRNAAACPFGAAACRPKGRSVCRAPRTGSRSACCPADKRKRLQRPRRFPITRPMFSRCRIQRIIRPAA